MAAGGSRGLRWMARGDHELPPTEEWLTPGEANRLARMPATKRRREYLLRRWVGKHAVAVVAGLPTDLPALGRIEVANLPSGAPYARVDGDPLGLEISIADRAGWAVCVLAEDPGPVGCDIEIVEPRTPAFVADYFTADERAYVASRPASERDAVANLIWSAKESALKVLQTGLRRDTRSVEVVLETPGHEYAEDAAAGAWSPLEVRTAEGTRLPGWWRREGTFLVTVAAGHPLSPPTSLAGSADLGSARPSHPWLERPLAP